MEALRTPSAVLFDMGGTLLRAATWEPEAGNRSVLELSSNAHGVTAAEVSEAIRVLNEDLHARREASWMEVSPWAVQRLVYERLGIEFEVSPHEVEAVFLRSARSWTPEPGVSRALVRLTALGLPMAVVSNSAFSGEGLTCELELHGLADFFWFIMSSADYIVRKPHPALFQTAAGKLGVAPDAVWYVGDMPQYDIAGARAAGMISVLYAPNGVIHENPKPHAVVPSWDLFAELVARSM